MILIAHIFIALASMAHSTFLFFVPSQKQLLVSYALVAATIGSGTYLVVSSHANVLNTCLMGLFYLGFVSIGIVSTQYKLAHELIHKD